MLAARLLILLVASPELDTARLLNTQTALREALGADVVLDVRPLSANAIPEQRPDAVRVNVSWNRSHTSALIVLESQVPARSRQERLSFRAVDPDAERGRAVGLAIAAMLPEWAAPAPDLSPSPVPAVTRVETAARKSEEQPSYAVDFAGLGAMGLGQAQTGGGFALGGQLRLWRELFVRASAAVRAGPVPQVAGSSFRTALGFGGGAGVAKLSQATLSVRADLLLLYESIARAQEERQSRWMPGVDLFFEGEWPLMPALSIFTGVGVEAALGTTDLYVRGQRAGSVPIFRGIAQLGVRARW